ncbi:hypothetical protein BD626DRAFT_501354 [Schizophyllum amplum]|uniref:Uncharacterized protein n=1 Tax=Schizophyllum amplum TaxID=97359 RepID=A0A550C9Q9_9AGAR|nr:hypothetical protein BD626DRAFT_501354 [Auriculariopsis ampla]
MLASLSSRLLDVRVEYKRAEEDQTIIVDVDALRELSVPDVLRELAVPDVATRLAGLCGRIYSALGDDVQTLSQALLALENDVEEAVKGARFCHLQEPLILPSPCPGVPTIIITPAPPSPPVTTRTLGKTLLSAPASPCRTSRVQRHAPSAGPNARVHNAASRRLGMAGGRWVALLPGLDAQAARGVYSRPLVVRRKV